MEVETILPVFSDRIKITARQWAEPVSPAQCYVCSRVHIEAPTPPQTPPRHETPPRHVRDTSENVPPAWS